MNVELLRKVRDHLATRTEPMFHMASRCNCIMHDARVVLGMPDTPQNDWLEIGRQLDMPDKATWELFYASSIPCDVRALESYTKDEALAVLDRVIETGDYEGAWIKICGDKPRA